MAIYFGLTLIYDFYIEPETSLDESLIYLIISQAEFLLALLGYDLLPSNSMYQFHFGIADTTGVIVGAPCNGISLFILYVTFVCVFKGKVIYKLLFGICGVVIIHLLNMIRVLALALVVKFNPDMLDFHHKYTFTLFVYVMVFLMWFLRIKLYQKFRK